jgi:hypothetical protein
MMMSAEHAAADLKALVCAAFRLGWAMEHLYERRIPEKPQPRGSPPACLPSATDLRMGEAIERDLAAIRTALRVLSQAPELSQVELPTPADTEAQFASVIDADSAKGFRLSLLALHLGLARSLGAADFRFGQAYDLGRALAELSRLPSGAHLARLTPELSTVLRSGRATARKDVASDADTRAEPTESEVLVAWCNRRFDPHRVTSLVGKLQDLASALPAHTGKAVAGSLGRVAEQIQTAVHDDPEGLSWPRVRTTLERQGQIWRSLLAGELDAHEALLPDSYIEVARRSLETSRVLLSKYVRIFWAPLLLVLILVAGAIAAATIGSSVGGSIAGVAALLTTLVFGAQGARMSVATVVAELPRPLWDAGVDEVLAKTITQPMQARVSKSHGDGSVANRPQDDAHDLLSNETAKRRSPIRKSEEPPEGGPSS